jgi:2-polyprenyl-6-methoxyphenol hydroxylase-like FAD-dependent oxidoreductase
MRQTFSSAEPTPVEHTDCVVVGGGPGGAVLSLLLARCGVEVTLLESHPDFDREFRGDTLHPSVMEIMAELGLAERLLALRHSKLRQATIQTADGPFTPVDFSRLSTRFPYITVMPQKSFLEFVTAEAARYPGFKLVMGARVVGLIEGGNGGGAVRGVRYESKNGEHELRAGLTVGADGRGSRVRRLAGFEPVKTSPPMDVLWFKLPKEPGDPEGLVGRFGGGRIAILLDRDDHWQAGYVLPKGSFPELRRAGVEELWRRFDALAPEFAGRARRISDWQQVSLLSVESSRCRRWFKPGLLLIGDAAHVMSPVGGVGINYAVQDAVAAANILSAPLLKGDLRTGHLAAVQARRDPPTRFIQRLQKLVQNRVLAPALSASPDAPVSVPRALRALPGIPLLRGLPARVIGYGIWPSRLRVPSRREP